MKKTVYKIFTIADDEREAAYLRQMHQSGWKLVKISLSPFLVAVKYTFEACEKEDVAYQLDFYPMKKSEREAYFQLFADYGWEHIQNFNDFSFFRKKVGAEDVAGETELYTDARTKLDMVNRLVRFRLLPVLCLFVLSLGIIVRYFSTSIFLWIDGFLLWLLSVQLLYILSVLYQKRKNLKEKGDS